MQHAYVSLRIPAELAADLDRLAEAEAKRTGLNVTRSELIRRAIIDDLAKRAPEEKKGGAK